MCGNTWECTADWFFGRYAADAAKVCCIPRNPRVPSMEDSIYPLDATRFPRKVLKGGSHLCAENYCRRYRPAVRHPEPVNNSTSQIGFRCVVRAAERSLQLDLDLSRIYAAPIARLARLAFEGQGEPSRFSKRSGLSMPRGWTGATQTWVLVCKGTQCRR